MNNGESRLNQNKVVFVEDCLETIQGHKWLQQYESCLEAIVVIYLDWVSHNIKYWIEKGCQEKKRATVSIFPTFQRKNNR